DPQSFAEFPVRFVRSLARLGLVLIPEYFIVVMALGLVSGWWSAFGSVTEHLGVLAIVACAVIGTLLVVPTGGEIPVVLALASTGVAAGVAGTLLITLPALSVPSMVMVARA